MGRDKEMIFSKSNHIEQIIAGTKTQTRRPSDKYQIGKTYAIQPGRGKPGIEKYRILITGKRKEYRGETVSVKDALAEGGYTPEEYETLYESMYPSWLVRYVYTFRVVVEGKLFKLKN